MINFVFIHLNSGCEFEVKFPIANMECIKCHLSRIVVNVRWYGPSAQVNIQNHSYTP